MKILVLHGLIHDYTIMHLPYTIVDVSETVVDPEWRSHLSRGS